MLRCKSSRNARTAGFAPTAEAGCHTRLLGADGGAHVLVLQVDVLLARNGCQPQLDFRQ